MRRAGASWKKFSRRGRPGVLLERASPRRASIALMALDLPEFERPANATSAPSSCGNCTLCAALVRNSAAGYRLTQALRRGMGPSVQFRGFGAALSGPQPPIREEPLVTMTATSRLLCFLLA